MAKNLPQLMLLAKKKYPKLKNFFYRELEDSPSLDGLNSSLAQLTGELWSCKDLANIGKLYHVYSHISRL